jgi:hypothetical protein
MSLMCPAVPSRAVLQSTSKAIGIVQAGAFSNTAQGQYISGVFVMKNQITNAYMAHLHIGNASVANGPIGAWIWPTDSE